VAGVNAIEEWLSHRVSRVRLGPSARRVADILTTQPHLASYASTADLAERAGVNVATVVRTARALGFTGWPDLRLELRSRYLGSPSANQLLAEHDQLSADDPVTAAIRRDMENLETLGRTVDVAEVRSIATAIHAADRTVVTGSGTFAAPGVQLAHGGTTMGLDIRLERHFGTALANTVARLRGNDVFVALNFWWLPQQLLDATRVAAERGATVCVVTDQRTSALTEPAKHVAVVPSEGASSFPSLTAAMSLMHALLAEIARLGGTGVRQAMSGSEDTWRRMRLFHRQG
jgi:DNA-binding MurR/RpiR family transcriptional regulator